MSLVEIVQKFKVEGMAESITPHGNGHIHQTFKVKTNKGRCYLLQKINDHVFQDVEGLMNNLHLVTEHLQSVDTEGPNLVLIKTKSSRTYLNHNRANWRLFVFLEELQSHDLIDAPEMIHEGAKALGKFIRNLSGLDPTNISAPIKKFHDLSFRIQQFVDAKTHGITHRISQCQPEIRLIESHAANQLQLEQLKNTGKIPIRICHNDTKLNNVLFDKRMKAKLVIDLDTVMPGIVHYDYGDGIRTACSTTNEDERDLHKVGFDTAKLEAFDSGFLEPVDDLLTSEEKKTLRLAIPLFPYMQAVRFLTDYLLGDQYYHTQYEDHNLVRARNQLALFKEADKLS